MSEHEHPHQTQASSAIIWSIATALFLAVLKIATGIMTHSMAVLASALDSVMDAVSSLINFFAARAAAKPPDENHAYGHGKIESLASLFQSLAIAVSGLYLILESVRRLLQGSMLEDIRAGVAVMAFSLFVTLALIFKLTVAQRQTGSLILKTEKLHYTMDILTNGGTIAALLLVKATGHVLWDLLFSIFIALYVFKIAYGILKQAVDELLDKKSTIVSKEEIAEMIRQHHPSVGGLHNFRTRQVGKQIFMDFHVEIRGEDDFKKAHLMTEGLIDRIREKYPDADITVHYDPEGER